MTTLPLAVHASVLSKKVDYVSKEQYWQMYYDHPDESYEWNNGYLEAKPMSSVVEFELYLWFMQLLNGYLAAQSVGRIIGLETGFEMVSLTKNTIRKPDIAIVRHDNPVPLRDKDRRYEGIFDLCVESVSTSSRKEIERDTVTKRQEYELAGVQEYYILDERGRETVFLHNMRGNYQPLPESEDVIQSVVLPGFQFRRSDLSSRPSLEQLALDSVYQGYILPAYQAARRQVLQERQEKEKLAAKLRQLGIDPDTLD